MNTRRFMAWLLALAAALLLTACGGPSDQDGVTLSVMGKKSDLKKAI